MENLHTEGCLYLERRRESSGNTTFSNSAHCRGDDRHLKSRALLLAMILAGASQGVKAQQGDGQIRGAPVDPQSLPIWEHDKLVLAPSPADPNSSMRTVIVEHPENPRGETGYRMVSHTPLLVPAEVPNIRYEQGRLHQHIAIDLELAVTSPVVQALIADRERLALEDEDAAVEVRPTHLTQVLVSLVDTSLSFDNVICTRRILPNGRDRIPVPIQIPIGVVEAGESLEAGFNSDYFQRVREKGTLGVQICYQDVRMKTEWGKRKVQLLGSVDDALQSILTGEQMEGDAPVSAEQLALVSKAFAAHIHEEIFMSRSGLAGEFELLSLQQHPQMLFREAMFSAAELQRSAQQGEFVTALARQIQPAIRTASRTWGEQALNHLSHHSENTESSSSGASFGALFGQVSKLFQGKVFGSLDAGTQERIKRDINTIGEEHGVSLSWDETHQTFDVTGVRAYFLKSHELRVDSGVSTFFTVGTGRDVTYHPMRPIPLDYTLRDLEEDVAARAGKVQGALQEMRQAEQDRAKRENLAREVQLLERSFSDRLRELDLLAKQVRQGEETGKALERYEQLLQRWNRSLSGSITRERSTLRYWVEATARVNGKGKRERDEARRIRGRGGLPSSSSLPEPRKPRENQPSDQRSLYEGAFREAPVRELGARKRQLEELQLRAQRLQAQLSARVQEQQQSHARLRRELESLRERGRRLREQADSYHAEAEEWMKRCSRQGSYERDGEHYRDLAREWLNRH
ncbi:hypothetical protein MRY87_03070 [bacterium]|nr:hypothetical protein [bacterium]